MNGIPERSELDEGELSLIRWQYRMQGDFFKALWDAITRADTENLSKLGRAFPLHVNAYRRFATECGYWEDVKQRAKSQGFIPDNYD